MKISVIIPTFRRPVHVVANTLGSILSTASGLVSRIIVIDQNSRPLAIKEALPGVEVLCLPAEAPVCETGAQVIHLTGLAPSVTRAKNHGARWVSGELILFFDDDVTVQAGCISNYIDVFAAHPEAGFLGGREILEGSLKKEGVFKQVLRCLAQIGGDAEYKANGKYVGRIKSNSFMIKNFDVETDRLVRIDGARGCNWACRADLFFRAGGFDEAYQGTALREETDLYLRLNSMGAKGFYTSKSAVIHHRQAGGCDNLSASIKSLESKFTNEIYFQRKHFRSVSRIFFAIRTLPLVIQTLRESRGMGILIWLRSIFHA